MAVAPITPQEAERQHAEQIPDYVVEAVNELIVKHHKTSESGFDILQKEIIELVLKKAVESEALTEEDATPEYLFDHRYLDFEKLYKKAGWNVTYDKPGFNESYEPRFYFKKRKR